MSRNKCSDRVPAETCQELAAFVQDVHELAQRSSRGAGVIDALFDQATKPAAHSFEDDAKNISQMLTDLNIGKAHIVNDR